MTENEKLRKLPFQPTWPCPFEPMSYPTKTKPKPTESRVVTIPRWETFLLELHNVIRRLEKAGLSTDFPEINKLLERETR